MARLDGEVFKAQLHVEDARERELLVHRHARLTAARRPGDHLHQLLQRRGEGEAEPPTSVRSGTRDIARVVAAEYGGAGVVGERPQHLGQGGQDLALHRGGTFDGQQQLARRVESGGTRVGTALLPVHQLAQLRGRHARGDPLEELRLDLASSRGGLWRHARMDAAEEPPNA